MSGRGLLFLIGILLVVTLQWELTILEPIIIALVALLLLSWVWHRFGLAGLRFERSISHDRVSVGDLIHEEIRIANASWLPKLWLDVDDRSTLPHHIVSKVVSIRGRQERVWNVETMAARRGRYRTGPAIISTSDPAGLFPRSHPIPVTHEILVYPARVDVSGISIEPSWLEDGQLHQGRVPVNATAISTVRDYTPGDPLNRISWSVTARRGELMVKEFEPEPNSDLWILLDLNSDCQFEMRPREKAPLAYRYLDNSLEYIVAIGASLANEALRQNRQVGLLLNRDPPIRIDPDSTDRQWGRIGEILAVATSNGRRSLSEALLVESHHFSRDASVVLVTADTSVDWVSHAARLSDRRIPVTTVVVDAAGANQHDIGPLVRSLASAGIGVHRYNTYDAQYRREST